MNICIFSKYRHILGKENKGIHSFKFMNVSMVDYLLTIVLAFFISYITQIPVEIATIISFFLGIVSHLLFGVETTTTKYIKKISNNYISCKD